ncbi:MAG: hypothetical protein AB7R69_05580 [Candidatus Babeliales bacterium]
MTFLISLFIALQIILFFVMTFHDWVHIPPLTDIRELEKHSTKKGRFINSLIFALIVAYPLYLTYAYRDHYTFGSMLSIVLVYGLLTLGTILSWWIPYFFGSYSAAHKEAFAEYRTTHHFLPPIGDSVVPNTFHVLLHLLIWTCFGIALYLLCSF